MFTLKASRTGLIIGFVVLFPNLSWAATVQICSFNVQFLGSSTKRDDAGLTDLVKDYDVVVVQELVAPPYAGIFPNGKPFVPDAEARRFFDCMRQHGFLFRLSEEDTGPGLKNHINSSATEWWVAFYKPATVRVATDLPSGFLASDLTANPKFKRVPYAFPFRTVDNELDFVLISVHLQPGPGKANKATRKRELKGIADWIKVEDQLEKDFIILGDMNIEDRTELASATPATFSSLNDDCVPTNTNVNKPKPYDHVMFRSGFTGDEMDIGYGFKVRNLIQAMLPYWRNSSTKKYPGAPSYKHDVFRQYYSDHHPVDFQLTSAAGGDDD